MCDGEECGAEDDITNRPPVVESAEDEYKLGDYINDGADQGPEDVDDPKADWLCETETCEALESADGYEEGSPKDGQAHYAQELCGTASEQHLGLL